MPLNTFQIETIHSVIDLLFEPNFFDKLQDCLDDPQKYLQSLETSNPIKIGEVQLEILNYIKTLPETNPKLDWDYDLQENLVRENVFFHNNFVSHVEQYGRYIPPYEEIKPAHQIFSAQCKPKLDDAIYKLKVTLSFNPIITIIKKQFNLPHYRLQRIDETELEYDADCDKVLTEDATTNAEKIASEEILAYLKRENKISDIDLEDIGLLPYFTKKIVTYTVYFNLLKNNDANFFKNNFLFLSELEFNVITSSTILNRVKEGQCSIIEARQYSPYHVKLLDIPYYASLPFNSHIKILTPDNAKIFLKPYIINLLQAGKLEYFQTKEMTISAAKLLEHENYYQALMHNQISFDELYQITEIQCEKLLNPTVINLIIKHKLSIDTAKKLLQVTLRLLEQDPLVRYLIDYDLLDITTVKSIFSNVEPEKASLPSVLQKSSFRQMDRALIRKAIKDFIELAEQSLLYQSDLHKLIHKIEDVEELYSRQMDEEEDTAALLCNEFFRERCTLSLKEILKYRIEQHQAFDDLIQLCKRLNINFYPLRNEVIDSHLFQYLSSGHHFLIQNLINIASKIMLTPLDIWARYFALRIFSIMKEKFFPPEIEDLSTDSIEKIVTDLRAVMQQFNFQEQHFKLQIIAFCLRYLKKYIKNEFSLEELDDINIYKLIHDNISTTQKMVLASQDKTIWFKAYEHITQMLVLEQTKIKVGLKLKEMYAPPKNPNNHHALFNAPLNSKQGILKFCEGLSLLTKTLTPTPLHLFNL